MVKKDKKPTTAKSNGKKTTKNNPIKEVKAPKLDIDVDFLHNLVRAELAVVKTEEEKKDKQDKLEKIIFIVPDWFYRWVSEVVGYDEDVFYSKKRLNDTIEKEKKEAKEQYTKLLIRSIISSLWLWATAMFLILNT